MKEWLQSLFRLAVPVYVELLSGVLPLFGQAMANAVFKAEHDTRTPMRMALLANLINLVLDPVLIYGTFMGVTGAALATLAGRTIALGVSLAVLYRAPLTRQLRRLPAATGSAAREILHLGWPSSAEFLTRMVGGMLLTGVVARFGATALAAYGVGYKILLLSTMAFYSVRQAATIHTARDIARTGLQALPVTSKATLAAGLAAGAAAAALWSLAAPAFVGLFRPDPEVATAAVFYLRVMAIYVVPLSGLISLTGVFIGAGRSEPLFPLTAAGVALQFALAVVLGRSVGLAGVWASMVVSTLLQAVALHALFRGWLAPGKLVPEGVMQE